MRACLALLIVVPLSACASASGGGQLTRTPPAVAHAPVANLPERGQHVRVVFAAVPGQPERNRDGYLYRLTPDTLIMARGVVADTVLLGEGRQLQVVVRSRNRGRAGALLGMTGGALIGAVMGSAAYEPCVATGGMFDMSCMFAPTQGEMAAGGAILGGLAGGLAGYVIGSAIRTEEWGTVPLGRGVRVGVTPAAIALRVAI